jgi:hypothetical protein
VMHFEVFGAAAHDAALVAHERAEPDFAPAAGRAVAPALAVARARTPLRSHVRRRRDAAVRLALSRSATARSFTALVGTAARSGLRCLGTYRACRRTEAPGTGTPERPPRSLKSSPTPGLRPLCGRLRSSSISRASSRKTAPVRVDSGARGSRIPAGARLTRGARRSGSGVRAPARRSEHDRDRGLEVHAPAGVHYDRARPRRGCANCGRPPSCRASVGLSRRARGRAPTRSPATPGRSHPRSPVAAPAPK